MLVSPFSFLARPSQGPELGSLAVCGTGCSVLGFSFLEFAMEEPSDGLKSDSLRVMERVRSENETLREGCFELGWS